MYGETISVIMQFIMVKLNLKNKITILIFFSFILIGIADATNPGHGLISISVSFILVLVSFFFGLYRFKLNKLDSLLLLLANIGFLIFTFNTKIFLINIFLLSLLVWSLAAPFLTRLKVALPAAIIATVFLSFVIPYYKLPFPLLPILYFPFFIFGYILDNVRFKRNRMTKLYCLTGILISAALLYNSLHRSLKITEFYGKVYIQSMFSDKTIYAFAPIIVIGFFLLAFSVLILSTRIFDHVKFKNKNYINWRASILSASILLPLLYAIFHLHPERNIRLCLLPASAVLYLITYYFTDMKVYRRKISKVSRTEQGAIASQEAVFKDESDVPEFSIDINRLLLKIQFIVCYIMAVVISIEFIMRSNNISLTLQYTSTASFAYNLIFVCIFYLFITAVLGMGPGTILTTLVHAVLLLANYLKITYFSEPFFPWDFTLINDAIMIARDYLNIYTVAVVSVLLLAGIILIIRNFKKIIRFLKPKPDFKFVIILMIPMVFNLQLLAHVGLKDINIVKDWYDGIKDYMKNGTYVENVIYLQNIKRYLNLKPAGYSSNTVRELGKKLETPVETSNIKPDIIVVLGETYWDPTNLSDVRFNKEIAGNLKQYRSGTMISPAFGGGTANVEFEVLTGFSNFFFNTSIMPYTVYFKRNTPSVVSAFRDNGYDTVAIHPNTGNMYNRNNVYKYIGFEEFKDVQSFDPVKDIKGNYTSDDSLVKKISDTLKEKTGPAFILGISMQNHDPYGESIKHYGTGKEIQVESDKLDDAEKDVLSSFAQGVYDEDKALGELIDVAKNNDRPTIVYFFGDHLPRLGVGLAGGNYDIFKKLGFTDGKTDPRFDKRFYETPLVTWANYKDLQKYTTPLSSSQLAIEILKDSGIKYPSYFNELLEIRNKYPYLTNYLNNKTELANDKSIKDYYMIQYDIMFGRQYLVKK